MSYIRDRMIQAGVTMYGIVTISFIFIRLMPGGPADYLEEEMGKNPERYGLPPEPTQLEILNRIEQILGSNPNKPILRAYVDYLYQVFVEFDLGTTVLVGGQQPVAKLLLEHAPWTIFLSSIGLAYGLVIGISLGSIMAYYEGTKFDVGMTVAMILDGAIPYYVAAIFLLFLFGFQLGWFPTGGRMNPQTTPGINWPFIAGVLKHATLPALSTIIVGFGAGALGLRANAIRLLGSDYLQVARLRGLSTTRIATAYLARNAILPMYTGIIISLGGLLGGSVILEEIFNYRGMGLIMFEATLARDFPLLQGALIITTGLFVAGTLIADFTYSLVDPRVDLRGMEE